MEDLIGKVNDAEKRIKEGLGSLTTRLEMFAKDFSKGVPREKKDIVINGKNVVASIYQDGKVAIHFATTDDANEYYKKLY